MCVVVRRVRLLSLSLSLGRVQEREDRKGWLKVISRLLYDEAFLDQAVVVESLQSQMVTGGRIRL